MANATPALTTSKPNQYQRKVSSKTKTNVRGDKVVIESIDTIKVDAKAKKAK